MTSNAGLTIDGTKGTIDLRDAIAEFGAAAQLCIDDAPIYVMEIEDDGSLTGRVYTGTFSNATETSSGDAATGVLTINDIKLDGVAATKSASVMVDYYIDLPGQHVYEADITPDTFGGNYYVEADTLFRDQYTGKDMPANLTFPNVRLQSNFTMTFAGTGDPSTFDFTMDAFPGYTYFDKKKKVLCVLQVVDSIGLGGNTSSNDADPVMYHDDVDQHATEATRDSQLTEDQLGAKVNTFAWADGTEGATKTYEFIHIKDAIDFTDLTIMKDEDGNEIDQDTITPVYTVTGNTNGYISVGSDGHIIALKNTPEGAALKVSASVQSKTGTGSTVTTLTKELTIKVTDSSIAEG